MAVNSSQDHSEHFNGIRKYQVGLSGLPLPVTTCAEAHVLQSPLSNERQVRDRLPVRSVSCCFPNVCHLSATCMSCIAMLLVDGSDTPGIITVVVEQPFRCYVICRLKPIPQPRFLKPLHQHLLQYLLNHQSLLGRR